MGSIIDFSGIKNCEQAIRKTWDEFRECLAAGVFSYDEIEKAKKQKFLMVYDDLFYKHSGIDQSTIVFKDLKDKLMGRGAILKNDEIPNYDRFLPKEEYIKEDNRFSPPHVEWLYLAVGNDNDIHECAQAECRAKRGNMFGFCHFQRDTKYDMCKLVDLTIADDISYVELNATLEKYVQTQTKKRKKIIKATGFPPKINIDQKELEKVFTQWAVYTYVKLLSTQIFKPLDSCDNKAITYAPFQTIAQYYISLGYSGIVYDSIVCLKGKNIVLFDKHMACPVGTIENYKIL